MPCNIAPPAALLRGGAFMVQGEQTLQEFGIGERVWPAVGGEDALLDMTKEAEESASDVVKSERLRSLVVEIRGNAKEEHNRLRREQRQMESRYQLCMIGILEECNLDGYLGRTWRIWSQGWVVFMKRLSEPLKRSKPTGWLCSRSNRTECASEQKANALAKAYNSLEINQWGGKYESSTGKESRLSVQRPHKFR
jgi:hypothetical protein